MEKINTDSDFENWKEELRSKKYTKSTITKKINEASYKIFLALPGKTPSEKSKNLFDQFKKDTSPFKIKQYYDGLKIGLPAKMYLSNSPRSAQYELTLNPSNKQSVQIRHLVSEQKPSGNYSFLSINDSFENESWRLLNPTIEENLRLFPTIGNVVPRKDFLKDTVEITSNPQYRVRSTDNKLQFDVSQGITNNCQLCIVGSAQNLLMHCTHPKEQLYEVYRKTGKRIALFDIKENYMEKLRQVIPKDKIILISPYKSTNGSNMNIILINIEKIMV